MIGGIKVALNVQGRFSLLKQSSIVRVVTSLCNLFQGNVRFINVRKCNLQLNGNCFIIYLSVHRFKVQVKAIDQTGSTSLIFDREATQFLGKTASEIRQQEMKVK